MTDHANELRRYSRKIGQPAGDVPSVMRASADEIERLAAMLEEAESDALEQARLNGMGSEREAALMAKLKAAEKERDDANAAAAGIALQAETLQAERDALRAKIAEMEQQEPYSYIYEYANPIDGSPVWRDTPGYWNAQFPRSSKPLYALPGAKGE